MSLQAVLAPLFAQVGLAFVVLFRLAFLRARAVKAKEVRTDGATPRGFRWPLAAQLASDDFQNQFELPVLFYALVPLAILAHKADLAFVVMAWVFVISRWLHAFEHMGPNRLAVRLPAFIFGSVVLFAMWLVFALRVLLAV